MLPRCEAGVKILVSPRRAVVRRFMRAYKGEGDRFVSAVLQLLIIVVGVLFTHVGGGCSTTEAKPGSKFKGLVSPRRRAV
jgi:hypothetical protein